MESFAVSGRVDDATVLWLIGSALTLCLAATGVAWRLAMRDHDSIVRRMDELERRLRVHERQLVFLEPLSDIIGGAGTERLFRALHKRGGR